MMKDGIKDTPFRGELRERVILEAMEAFRKYGIKNIRMDDIANALKMSKRTLYEIFENKETLLKECIIHHHEMKQKDLGEIIRTSKNVLEVILKCYKDSIEMFHRTNPKFFEDIEKYPEVCDVLKDKRGKSHIVVIDFLKRGVDQGIFREDINFAIIHALLQEQMDLLVHSNVCKQFSFLEVYEVIMFIYLRGIATPKGAQELDDFIREYRKEQVHAPGSTEEN
jgi:AcrR family transcriptional regulator